jgi:hypothetical protein
MKTMIQFSKSAMTVRDLQNCAEGMQVMLEQMDAQFSKTEQGNYDWTPEQADEFVSRMVMVARAFEYDNS